MTAWLQRDKLLDKKVWSFKIDLTKGVVICLQGCGYLPTKGVVIHLQRVWLFAYRLVSRGASTEDLITYSPDISRAASIIYIDHLNKVNWKASEKHHFLQPKSKPPNTYYLYIQ